MHCGSVERTKTTNCVFIQQITDQTVNLYSASVPSLVETTTGTVLQFPMFDLVMLWLEPRCHSSKIFTFLKYRLGDSASQKLKCFFKLHNVCQEKTVLALYSHTLAVYFFVIRLQHFYCWVQWLIKWLPLIIFQPVMIFLMFIVQHFMRKYKSESSDCFIGPPTKTSLCFCLYKLMDCCWLEYPHKSCGFWDDSTDLHILQSTGQNQVCTLSPFNIFQTNCR